MLRLIPVRPRISVGTTSLFRLPNDLLERFAEGVGEGS